MLFRSRAAFLAAHRAQLVLRVRRANDLFPSFFSTPFFFFFFYREPRPSCLLGLGRPRAAIILSLSLSLSMAPLPTSVPFSLHRVPFVDATCAARAARTPPRALVFSLRPTCPFFFSVSVTRDFCTPFSHGAFILAPINPATLLALTNRPPSPPCASWIRSFSGLF